MVSAGLGGVALVVSVAPAVLAETVKLAELVEPAGPVAALAVGPVVALAAEPAVDAGAG